MIHQRFQHASVLGSLLAVAVGSQVTAQNTWQVRPEIIPRWDCGSAFDAVRGRMVVFGGSGSGNPNLAETIEWDGVRWEVRQPATTAPQSFQLGTTAVYDAARREVVSYAGETWVWDGYDWTQRQPAASPPRRVFAAMAYDPIRQRTVLFGGSATGGLLNETWEWDGVTWTQATPGTSPAPRMGAKMAWDAVHQEILLFGGNNVTLSDTWSWDGSRWQQRQPANSPAGSTFLGMASDPARQRVVLIQQARINGPLDTWEWDGNNWSLVPTANAPFTAWNTCMEFDPVRQAVVVAFGDMALDSAQTWQFDGNDWTQVDVRLRTIGLKLVDDAARGRVVGISTGTDPAGTFELTWEWDGIRWVMAQPATRLPLRRLSAVAYDSARQRTLVFGGGPTFSIGSAVNDMWEWDGVNWSLATPSVRPAARAATGMAYDAARGQAVVFGGRINVGGVATPTSETWLWDGQTWQQPSPTTQPGARIAPPMAFDPMRQRIVLCGGGRPTGGGSFSDTWEWDGSNWTLVATTPPGITSANGATMIYDPTQGQVVLTGRRPGGSHEMWGWNGTIWSPLGQVATGGPSLVFDAARQQLVAFDGFDTHILRPGAPAVAAATPYGAGCPGSAGQPTLGARGLPHPGHSGFTLELNSGRPNSFAAILLSDVSASVPVAGCTQLVGANNSTWALATNAGGFASLPLPIPLNPIFLGFSMSAQGVVLDPQGAGAGLFSATAGLRLTVGD